MPMRPYAYIKYDAESAFIHRQTVLARGRTIIAGSLSLVGLSLITYVGGYYGLWQVRKNVLANDPTIVDTIALAPQSAFTNEPLSPDNPIRSTASALASDDSSEYFSTFRISVPRLSVQNALVTSDVMSDNKEIYLPVLTRSLAHYKGSAYPGEDGNVIIYGHSILPAFYNPKNYLSIFSKLDTLKKNDAISVTWGNKVFTYRVEGMSVVSPDDTRVLQYNNGKTLTLLTCVPPGLTTDRLLVFASLEE